MWFTERFVQCCKVKVLSSRADDIADNVRAVLIDHLVLRYRVDY